MLVTLTFGLLMVDVFLTLSRLFEIINLAADIRIPYLVTAIHVATVGLVIITGGARKMVGSRVGIYLGLFTCWMMACTLTSIWRGGSVSAVSQWSIALLAFISCGAVVTLRQSGKIAAVIAAGTAVVAFDSYWAGIQRQGRLAFQEGTLGNANDLSMLLLLGLPFFLVPMFSRKHSRIQLVLALAAGASVLLAFVLAGSRGGLLALLAMLIVLFWTRPIVGKFKLGLLTIALFFVFYAVTPQAILSRYLTIFSDPTTMQDLRGEAYGSKLQREYLLEQSLKLTLAHPFFGLGPGVFMVGEADLAKSEGIRAQWRVSHNSVTQLSSEMGFPGLLLYLTALWYTFRNLFWFRAHSGADPTGRAYAIGLALLLSVVGLCVNLIFSSGAYESFLPLLMGLSVAFRCSLQREIDLCSRAASAPEPQLPARTELGARQPGKASYRFLGRPPRAGA